MTTAVKGTKREKAKKMTKKLLERAYLCEWVEVKRRNSSGKRSDDKVE